MVPFDALHAGPSPDHIDLDCGTGPDCSGGSELTGIVFRRAFTIVVITYGATIADAVDNM
jgi:hypothetical protein